MANAEIDKYGRILIPKQIRDKLGLKPEVTLEIKVRGTELLLRAKDEDLEKRVQDLGSFLRRQAPEPFVNQPAGNDSKWLSKKYCLKKLGL